MEVTKEVTKAQIINMVASDARLNSRDAKQAVEAFINILKMELRNHHDIQLAGFGRFQVRATTPRVCRNFQTGEVITTEPRLRATFKQSQTLRAVVNGRR